LSSIERFIKEEIMAADHRKPVARIVVLLPAWAVYWEMKIAGPGHRRIVGLFVIVAR
jgi:hypothetical protein